MPESNHILVPTLLQFGGGAAYSVEPEVIGLEGAAYYLDAVNMRYDPMDNNDFSMKKIFGETLLYDSEFNANGKSPFSLAATYKCMFSCIVAGRLFEVWCDSQELLPAFFRAAGIVVAYSEDIPFSVTYPMNGHWNDGGGGEIFLNDRFHVPHQYSLKDLYEASGIDPLTLQATGSQTDKYFDDYTDRLYQINQETNADHVVFIACTTIQPPNATTIGSGGQKGGSVQYLLRFKDLAGNPSGWSFPSPLIPIPKKQSPTGPMYPFARTYGASVAEETIIGAHIRFRITNLSNFTSYQIRRITFNSGSPINAIGADEIIFEEGILPNQISVKDIWDIGATGDAYDAANDESNTLAVINNCQDIRYYNKKLWLFAPEYQSRDIEGLDFLEVTQGGNSDVIVPAMKFLGVNGHKDIYNQVYFKSQMHEEARGWAVVGFDGFGQHSLGKRITGTSAIYTQCGDYENFNFPKRRDESFEVSSVAEVNTFTHFVEASNVDGLTTDTFDVMQYENFIRKNRDYCQYKNIGNLDTNGDYPISAIPDVYGCDLNINGGTDDGTNVQVDYQPWHPVGELDPLSSGYEFNPIGSAWGDGSTEYDPGTYKPKDFAPEYYALGLKFGGVDNASDFPWMKAFAVVETPPANKVFAQGMAMYALSKNESPYSNTLKALDKVWCYFPDVEAGLVDMADVIENPDNYEVHLQSPMGFSSEVYNMYTDDSVMNPENFPGVSNIDMISYARIYFENGDINYGDTTGSVGNAGFVTFNKWRNTNVASLPADLAFDILSIKSITTPSANQTYFEVELSDDIYATSNSNNTVTDNQFLNAVMKNFHEPIYVVNIVRKNAQVDTSVNTQQYYGTEHYQKLESIVGKGNGDILQSYIMVDERWEDFYATDVNVDKFVYVQDTHGVVTKWVDVALKDIGQRIVILNDIVAQTGTYGDCAGVYTTGTATQDGVTRFYYLNFDYAQLNPAAYDVKYFAPAADTLILVRYDNRFPCNVFGGDCVTGEATWAPFDGLAPQGGIVFADLPIREQPYFGIAWPYLKWSMNPRVYILDFSATATVQVTQDFMLWIMRQLVMMFTCTTRTNVPLVFNGDYPNKSFPLVHYVMRPNHWDPDKSIIENDIFPQYAIDYPEEVDSEGLPLLWQYGGFRYKQGFLNSNIDYSHVPQNFIYLSKPKVGFVEITRFPTRVHWSATREIAEQNSPALKTFPILNVRDIDDSTGEITKAWSAWAESGDNLYAFTENGCCLLMTEKFQMIDGAGGQAMIVRGGAGAQAIMQEIWISRTQGIDKEFWRTFAEYSETCWYVNSNSMYRMRNNEIRDWGRSNYHSRIYQDFIQIISEGVADDVTGYYDILHDEYWFAKRSRIFSIVVNAPNIAQILPDTYENAIYPYVELLGTTGVIEAVPASEASESGQLWIINSTDHGVYVGNSMGAPITALQSGYMLHLTVDSADDNTWTYEIISPEDIDDNINRIMFVFCDESLRKAQPSESKWVGTFEYRQDRWTANNNISYGMRQAKTFLMNTGDTFNDGEPVTSQFLVPLVQKGAAQELSVEFTRVRINSNEVPDDDPKSVYFYATLQDMLDDVVFSSLGAEDFRDYNGQEAFIPRQTDEPNARAQGRVFLMKIVDSSRPNFKIMSIELKTKKLK